MSQNVQSVLGVVLDALPESIAIVDAKGRIIYVNRAWRVFAEQNAEAVVRVSEGANYLDVSGSASGEDGPAAAAFADAIHAALAGSTAAFEMEYPCHSPEEERWFCGRVMSVEHDQGRYALVVHENITERKCREKMVADLERRFRLLADTTTDGLWIMSLDYVFRYVHPVTMRILGYAREELEGAGISDFCDEQNFALISEATKGLLERLPDTTPVTLEVQMLRKDGAAFWVEICALINLDGDGNPIGVQGVMRNIDERKQAQDNANRFKTVFDNANFGAVIMNLGGTIAYVNHAFAAAHGFTPESLLGAHVSKFHTREQMRTVAEANKRMLEEGGFNAMEIWHKHREGREFPMLMNGMLVRDASGAPSFMAFTGVDISERKQTELALEKSERRVREKLDAISCPDGDMGKLRLDDILDCDAIQEIMNDFHRLTNIGVAIMDTQGRVLVATGWQDICTRYHRIHPETQARCLESDIELSSGVAPGEFKLYRCKNNLWDMATPIFIGAQHLGNLYLGQFIFGDEQLDIELFRNQARAFGFDETAYLDALQRVPRWSPETVNCAMAFYVKFANLVARLSYGNIQLMRAFAERDALFESLRASENNYRTLVQSANSVILRFDAKGTILFMNDYGLLFFGFTAEELHGQSLFGTIVPEREDTGRDLIAMIHDISAHTDRYVANVNQNSRKDGTRVWVSWTNQAIKNDAGETIEILSIGHDITDLKNAQDEIASRERLLQHIFEVLPVGLWFADKNGTLLRGNPAGVKIWGAEPKVGAENYGVFKARRLPSGEEVRPEEWALLRSVREGVTITDELLEIEAFDGEKRTILNSTASVKDEQGEIQGAIIVNLDISELVKTEQALREREEELRHAQKIESVGRLAGGVAHDFNNMLQTILGYAEMAIHDLPPDNPIQEYLQEVHHAASRSADLTSQLLTFARKQVIRPRSLDLNDHIANTLKMLRRLIGENVELVWTPSPQQAQVKMDPVQVDQILANLVVNARDAITDVGKIAMETRIITVDERNRNEHLNVAPGVYVQLTVTDDGHGMDEATRALVFEPFFTTKGVGAGTGLGLSTVYGIVTQNHGFVNCSSVVGRGTTFSILIPRIQDDGEEDAQPTSAETLSKGNETVLVVEDEEAVLRLAEVSLRNLGYNVLTANTPRQALQLMDAYEGKIHLLLTDVIMPQMNGRELYERLQRLRSDLKCLYMSGYTANVLGDQETLEAKGMFLLKPFSRADLARKVRAALDR